MPETWNEVDALQTWCDNCGASFLTPPVIPNNIVNVTCNKFFRVKCPYCMSYNLRSIDDFGMVSRKDMEDMYESIYWG